MFQIYCYSYTSQIGNYSIFLMYIYTCIYIYMYIYIYICIYIYIYIYIYMSHPIRSIGTIEKNMMITQKVHAHVPGYIDDLVFPLRKISFPSETTIRQPNLT